MKFKLFSSLLLVATLTLSCGGDKTEVTPPSPLPTEPEKPDVSDPDIDEGDPDLPLNQYNVLKSYVKHENRPRFQLGGAVSGTEYIKKEQIFSLANKHFENISIKNELKFSSIVNGKGEMDFSTVKEIVAAARSAKMPIYGHVLCWHTQQQPKYLNSLVNAVTTDQEKYDVMDAMLKKWIKGVFTETDGYIRMWDAVNESICNKNPSELKSQTNELDATRFYWQDYLGKDYARLVIKYARQYGGDDLTLFINDYGLESFNNNNAKCEGLIKMIEYWESDGVTKIDGIGTQMHLSFYQSETSQAKMEASVENMFKLLAASGKLVKITEFDMGYVNKAGDKLMTEDLTAAQHQQMADFYTYIISKYFEIIPNAQQFGITHWPLIDSSPENGWRTGEPVGLWDVDFERKVTYEGYVKGLKSMK